MRITSIILLGLIALLTFSLISENSKINNLEQNQREYETKIIDLATNYSTCSNDLKSQQEINNNLSEEIANYKENLNKCASSKEELLNNKKIYTPTLKILRDFVNDDNTDGHIYKNTTFDCTSFSNMFVEHFRERGFYSCVVEIDFDDDTAHDLVAVNTSDMGIVYVEPQTDQIFYGLNVGDDYCDIVGWDCEEPWTIVEISDCFKP